MPLSVPLSLPLSPFSDRAHVSFGKATRHFGCHVRLYAYCVTLFGVNVARNSCTVLLSRLRNNLAKTWKCVCMAEKPFVRCDARISRKQSCPLQEHEKWRMHVIILSYDERRITFYWPRVTLHGQTRRKKWYYAWLLFFVYMTLDMSHAAVTSKIWNDFREPCFSISHLSVSVLSS